MSPNLPAPVKQMLDQMSSGDKKIVKTLERVLLEIRVPRHRPKEGEQPEKSEERLAVAEQLFASLHSIYRGGLTSALFEQDAISFEVAASEGEIGFYVGVPLHLQSLVEKQIHAYYPDAEITPVPLYNVFARQGFVAATSLAQRKNPRFPVKTYRDFETDPMAGIVGALSKLGTDEGAAAQIMIAPTGHRWRKQAQSWARNYAQGKGGGGVNAGSVFGSVFKFGGDLMNAATTSPQNEAAAKPSPQDEAKRLTQAQEQLIEKVETKAGAPGFEVVIRLVSAAADKGVAELNLQHLTRAFKQFDAPDLNGFKEIVSPVASQAKLVKRYIFRELAGAGKKMILGAGELASIWHPPSEDIETPHVRWLGAKTAPPPANIPADGLLLGYNQYRGQTTDIRLKEDDRRRHMYAVGKTGMGKSVFLENMALQDIRAGKGVCFIDPHGDTAEKILRKIPRERAEDVIYFDPGDTERPMAFNMLDYSTPEQKDFVVQETVGIFYKLFGEELIGPKFEHWTRNGILTLMEDKETGAVLFDLPRLFSEREFAREKIAKVQDPVVKSFWQREMAQTSDFHKSEMLGYFISKFGRFITNEMMRNIIGQPKSAFDIRKIMDEGKILIMNLGKGRVGEINSALLGMIAVSKVQMAAMSRVNIPEHQRKDFYLYVDEFQNLTNEESIQSILSEARKYRLNLVIAHQYIAQLDEKVRDAVFGNVGTAVSFRVGADDA
ncbi:MAG: type IV secretion system DNA-binding domain-containing protein, partial [Patescibacteria group bacterium]